MNKFIFVCLFVHLFVCLCREKDIILYRKSVMEREFSGRPIIQGLPVKIICLKTFRKFAIKRGR